MPKVENKKFTITRSKWIRGDSGSKSFLLRGIDGAMCCLGMVLEQSGIHRLVMEDITTPGWLLQKDDYRQTFEELKEKIPGFLLIDNLENIEEGHTFDSDFCLRAISINDDGSRDDAWREEKLKEHFQTQGIELEFVD